MRAPYQAGDFPWPVKYGYLSVGVVEDGPSHCSAERCSPCSRTRPLTSCPPTRLSWCPMTFLRCAPLAGTVETAVNALWDAAPLLGDRVAVVGAGMVGCVARLLGRIPRARHSRGCRPSRADVAAALGVDFALASQASETIEGCDLVVHASATSAGLQPSLDLLAAEGTVIEPSWYGDGGGSPRPGGSFHSGRLGIRASWWARWPRPAAPGARLPTVRAGAGPPARSSLDALITGESPFEDLPVVMPRLADGSLRRSPSPTARVVPCSA